MDDTWNFTDLYSGEDDPRWAEDLNAALAAAVRFREEFHGRIGVNPSPELMAAALGRYEELQTGLLKPYLYAQLLFAADSSRDRHRALLARAREGYSGIVEETLFFELEVLRLEPAVYEALLQDHRVAACRHYLDRTRAAAPYSQSEEVEQALKRKDLSGREGFVQLFDELTASLRFAFTMPGEEGPREVTGEDLLGLLHHPDGGTRERALTAFLAKHSEQGLVLTACFNNLLLDHGREVDLRGYPDLMTPTHLACETEPGMVEQMMAVTEANYPLARNYFALKRRLLGVDRLKNTDLYAPVGEPPAMRPFAEARDLVLAAFAGFSVDFAAEAETFFHQQRIDVPPRPGKSGGAFCLGVAPGLPVYLLLNYTGNLRDVATLAHELGHGVHARLAAGQNLFHYHATLPLAETASVFCEMLLTRHLLAGTTDRQVRIALLCSKIEDIIATTFRQNVLTRFELAAHLKRGEGLLASDEICQLWWDENRRLFGDEVAMIEPYRWGWSYISHFIHARFYCYSYVFGELLVLALYRRYLQEGESFVPKYLDLLRAGGSGSPADLLRPLGIDLQDPGFWQQGYEVLADLVGELQDTLAVG